MKEKVTLVTAIFIVLFASGLLNAQSFSFQTHDTSKIALVNTEIIFDFPVINKSAAPIKVVIMRRAETIPSSWQGTMCFGENCFPPFMDSVDSDEIQPDDTVDFSYHFFADSVVGNATVTLVARNTRVESDSIMVTLTAATTTGINDKPETVKSYSLEQNYPNPFNPSTRISFSIPQREFVILKVYDLMGREVSSMINQELNQGNHNVSFNSYGLSSGTYFYKITAGSYTSIKKMIVLK